MPLQRSLRLEPLEDRRMLATVTVGNVNDVVNGSTSSIAALIANPGADGISLREAILAANAATTADTINFAPSLTSGGPAAIQLTNIGHVGELTIRRDVTINGPGMDLLTIRAFDPTPDMKNGDGSRIFNISDGTTINDLNTQRIVAIRDLTVTGGDAGDTYGGAIFNQEKLTGQRLRVSESAAVRDGGGIYSDGYGYLELTDCLIFKNSAIGTDTYGTYGGGVYGSAGTIARSTVSGNSAHNGGGLVFTGAIVDCLVENNHAAYGGGLLGGAASNSVIKYNTAEKDGGGVFGNQGTLVNGTITGNSAGRDGGGVSTGGGSYASSTILDGCTLTANTAGRHGGGIYFSGGLFGGQMLNTTVSGNSASNGGGIYLFGFIEFAVRHSTVVSNSSGNGFGHSIFFAGGPLTLDHSIVSNVLTYYGQTVQARYSIVSNNFGSPLVEAPLGTPDANGNLIGGPFHGDIDPKLGPLADHGGPMSTRAPLPGSPALNAGNPAAAAGVNGVPTVDGRGGPYVRVAGGRIDIGAYEQQSLPDGTLTVDTLVDEDDGHYGPGDFSLREAIDLARGGVGPDVIRFAPVLTASGPASIDLVHGALGIDSSLSILGPGAYRLTIDASGSNPVGSGVIGIRGYGSNDIGGDVAIKGLTITGGHGILGGGITSSDFNLTVVESRIINNHSDFRYGGAGGIQFTSGALKIYDSSITGNSTRYGGGVNAGGLNTSLEIHDSVINNNSARYGGGGISASSDHGPWTLTGSTVSNNAGGGILSFSDVTVQSSTINGNAGGGGGGISGEGNPATMITVIDSTISGNTGFGLFPSFGGIEDRTGAGGIFTYGNVIATRSTIVGNSVHNFDGTGGGISAVHISLDQTIVANNSANDVQGNVAAAFSMIGNKGTATVVNNGGSLIGVPGATINPLLGPLADNGGPALPGGAKMLTHAPLPGSPVIDAGNPSAQAGAGGVPQFDQRGAPYLRVADGRIDIGAIESQPAADFNSDFALDGFDFLAWQRGFGAVAPNATHASGDADFDLDVDATDLAAWTSSFGSPAVAAQSATASLQAGQSSASVIDAAFAMDQLLATAAPRRSFRTRVRSAR